MNWIFPCNVDYYDIHGAFDNLQSIDWLQRVKTIEEGDCVYIYLSKYHHAIYYKCLVVKVNKPRCTIDDSEYDQETNPRNEGIYVELKLLHKFDNPITIDELRQHGLSGSIQSQRRILDAELLKFIQQRDN